MIRIVALTEAGRKLAARIKTELVDAELWYKPQPFTEQVQQAFSAGDRLILICATGIAVRTLGPVLADKHRDPAVLVLDELGRFVIPLLSGHEGGANEWGAQVAEKIGAQLVLTTAKSYLKPVYCVGMGCERDTPLAEIADLFSDCLQQVGLNIDNLSSINSIDIKADEQGFIDLATVSQLPFHTWNKTQLGSVEKLLSTRSDYVFNTVGVYGVAESAALYGAQQDSGDWDTAPELLLPKQKKGRVTCAVARAYRKDVN
jgi:cobalt-precorrin 5A hydrolase